MSLLLIQCNSKKKVQEAPTVKTDTTRLQPVDSIIAAAEPADTIVFNTSAISANDYQEQTINLARGVSFKLCLLKGLNITVAAEGFKRPRFMALSPDGRLFITDLYDRSDNNKGQILICENWNDSSKKFEKIDTFLSGLRNPNQVAFYKGYLYIAETQAITRYRYEPGSLAPAAPPEIIARFPDYGLSYKYGGWHLTRSICFKDDKLYVSVGSSCNACLETEPVRASILQMNPDGSESIIFASGLRNSVGIKFIGNQLWATSMGRDLIGGDRPEDLFLQVNQGVHYGWPFYYQYKNKIYADATFKDSTMADTIAEPPLAYAGLAAHTAPLGFEFMKGFNDKLIRDAVLVCLHGSNSVNRHRGNEIVKIRGGNNYQPVITGFLQGNTEKQRLGRPCDILMYNENAFFFTDDTNGVLYYVYK
ncbi:MAG: PQQ-dependent sugar dehydrogenase [Ferruginibacter sp.]